LKPRARSFESTIARPSVASAIVRNESIRDRSQAASTVGGVIVVDPGAGKPVVGFAIGSSNTDRPRGSTG
jgi:hypothetical protein